LPLESTFSSQPVQIVWNRFLAPLKEELATSLKGVKEVLERGYGNKRTARVDWNEKSLKSQESCGLGKNLRFQLRLLRRAYMY